MGAYTLYIALGLALLLLLAPAQGASDGKAPFLTGVMVGWIFYGALTLMRVVPRYAPDWLMRFSIADLLVLSLMFGCLATYLSAWAVLNSRAIWAWLVHLAKRRGVGLELNGNVLNRIPFHIAEALSYRGETLRRAQAAA